MSRTGPPFDMLVMVRLSATNTLDGAFVRVKLFPRNGVCEDDENIVTVGRDSRRCPCRTRRQVERSYCLSR